MTKKRKKAVSKKSERKSSWLRSLSLFLFKLSLVGSVLAGAGLIYLDAQLRDKFEGKRWAIPAKVYARPLELYPGLQLSQEAIKSELQGLGYKLTNRADQPGTAAWGKGRVDLFTRGFQFPDGAEPARRISLGFAQGSLKSITDSRGGSLTLTRLEPILIGGIYPGDNEDRELVRLADVPQLLPDALIAVEDRDFYNHFGISLKGIARAIWVNLRAGRFAQGGSTLTQQLIKNFYLTSDRSLARKLLELPMAILLELHYSKQEILEAYLNEVYLGQDGARAIHGFAQGALFYFGRPLAELETHQLALMAGLIKGPSYYDPRRQPARATERRDLVLKLLLDQGFIDIADYNRGIAQPLDVVEKGSRHKGAYPAYLDIVKRQLRKEYREEDLNSEGVRVFTTLDPIVHMHAARALESKLDGLQERYGAKGSNLQGSVVVTDPQTGEVLALVGDRNARFDGFNRALDAYRPIGSLVKPALFLSALETGYTLISPLNDRSVKLQQPDGSFWEPQNFDGQPKGQVPLYEALSRSYNLSTAHLGLDLGVERVVKMLQRLGVEKSIAPFPSLFLGALALSPVEVAQIYQTIAANGFRMPLRSIRRVTDADNRELSRYPFNLEQISDPGAVHLLNYGLQAVAREGTARSLYQTLPADLNVSGKTGTSDQQRDSWFAGFTGNRLAVVWVGRDDNTSLPFTGSGGALAVWTELMRQEQPEPYIALKPDNIEYFWVDPQAQVLTDPQCSGSRSVPFIRGSEPKQRVSCTGQLRAPSSDHSAGDHTADDNILDWFKGWFR